MLWERIFTGLTCFFSVVLFFIAANIPPSKVESPLGTALWPQLILIILFISSAIHLLKLFLLRKEVKEKLIREAEQELKREEEETGERRSFPLLLFGFFISFIYFCSLDWIGFAIATPIFMGVFMYITGYRKKVILIVTPIIVTIVFLLLFVKATYIPLPRGLGIFRSISYLIY